MKKRIITLIFAIGLGLNLSAQRSDGFFANGSNYSEYREDVWAGQMPLLPDSHGTNYDFSAEAPIGSGILLLAAMGLAYGIRKKN